MGSNLFAFLLSSFSRCALSSLPLAVCRALHGPCCFRPFELCIFFSPCLVFLVILMAHTVLTQSFYAVSSDVTLTFWSQPNAEMLCRLLMIIPLTAISNLHFLDILVPNHILWLHLWPSATFNYLNCHVC